MIETTAPAGEHYENNCIELDAVDKWIDLRLPRLGQSYLSLRGQDDEETSFFCLAPISMTIESKDFLQRHSRVCPFTGNHAFYEKHAPSQVYVLAPTEFQTATKKFISKWQYFTSVASLYCSYYGILGGLRFLHALSGCCGQCIIVNEIKGGLMDEI